MLHTLILISILGILLGYYGLFMLDKAKNIYQHRLYWSYFITGESIYFIISLLTIRF